MIAMKIVRHTDCKTAANIYTHVQDEILWKETVNMDEVFERRQGGGLHKRGQESGALPEGSIALYIPNMLRRLDIEPYINIMNTPK